MCTERGQHQVNPWELSPDGSELPRNGTESEQKMKQQSIQAGAHTRPLGFQQVKQWNNCWRMVFAGAKEEIMTTDTVDEIMNSLLEIGSDL